jgi:hypothetical protein
LTKGVPFEWTEECQSSWETLKQCLTATPVLSYPCPHGDFILDTHASNVGIGAVLSQTQDGEGRVIGYYSRTLNKAERNYCATRKELLGAVAAIKHVHYFLYGRHFVVRTDHSALQWLVNFRDVQGQLARWLENLQQYDFTIVHRAGRSHANADALSRRPCVRHNCQYCQKLEDASMLPDHELCSSESEYSEEELSRLVTLTPQIELPSGSNFVPVKIKELQEKDLDVGPILCWLKKDSNRPEWSVVAPYGKVTKILWAQWDSLCIRDGCVYRLWECITPSSFHYQLVVPNELRSEVLKELHGTQATGHFGVNKTIQRVKQRFYWPQCQTDVKEFIKQCDGCSSRKGPPRKPKAPLQLYTVGAPMERIAIDIMGPLPVLENGYRYLLVTMDYFSKWPEVYPIPNQEARTVANALVREFFCRFAIPKELHSDQGRNFESNLLKDVCAILGILKLGRPHTIPSQMEW